MSYLVLCQALCCGLLSLSRSSSESESEIYFEDMSYVIQHTEARRILRLDYVPKGINVAQ